MDDDDDDRGYRREREDGLRFVPVTSQRNAGSLLYRRWQLANGTKVTYRML